MFLGHYLQCATSNITIHFQPVKGEISLFDIHIYVRGRLFSSLAVTKIEAMQLASSPDLASGRLGEG